MAYRDDFREARREFFWTLPRVGVAIVALLLTAYLIMVVATPLTIGLGWYKGEASVFSFGHVRAEYRQAYEYDRGMEAAARNVCIGRRNRLEPTAIAAYEQTYSNNEAKYDAEMADRFRAKRVKPADLPLVAPTLEQREKAVCA